MHVGVKIHKHVVLRPLDWVEVDTNPTRATATQAFHLFSSLVKLLQLLRAATLLMLSPAIGCLLPLRQLAPFAASHAFPSTAFSSRLGRRGDRRCTVFHCRSPSNGKRRTACRSLSGDLWSQKTEALGNPTPVPVVRQPDAKLGPVLMSQAGEAGMPHLAPDSRPEVPLEEVASSNQRPAYPVEEVASGSRRLACPDKVVPAWEETAC
mmetsp:Transcript_48570/g.84747  ORF Transcript_48570/g.84747 Transcript_48570/m.84747 type:complete len:208 (+) Transcript_48570:3-626(+)